VVDRLGPGFPALNRAIDDFFDGQLDLLADPNSPEGIIVAAVRELLALLTNPDMPLDHDRLFALDDIVRLADRVRRFTDEGRTGPAERAIESLLDAIHDYRAQFGGGFLDVTG
jgi:hypothetical protein